MEEEMMRLWWQTLLAITSQKRDLIVIVEASENISSSLGSSQKDKHSPINC